MKVMAARHGFCPLRVLLYGFFFLVLASYAAAQEIQGTAQSTSVDSVSILRSILEAKRQDRERLERMLDGLNVIDSVYRVHYPSWIIIYEDLRQRVIRAFRTRHPDVHQDSSVTIVANPEMTEIVEIGIGTDKIGRLEAHLNLSDSLHKSILESNYPLRRIERVSSKPRKSILFGVRPKAVSVDASAYGASLLFANGWGVEAKLGFDEVGYPFWSTGSARVLAIFDRLKIGVMIPVKFGRKEPRFVEPLTIRPRRLNGATGFAMEFDQSVGSDLVGLRIAVGELTKFVSGMLTDERRPYYLHTMGQLFYTRQLNLGKGGHLMTLTGGVGTHQIALGEVRTDEKIVAIGKTNFFSPILRVEYTRQAARMYGLGLQYYSSTLSVNAWLEFVKDFIYLDLRYSAPIFRDPKPWEQPYFYMISPRFRVAF